MAYADKQGMSGSRIASIVLVLLIHAVLGYAFVTGLAYNVVKQVGSYGDMYDRSITPEGLARGPNALWTKGGLQFAPPLR